MALNTLEHRDITKINRMLEWLVSFVARLAFAVGQRAEINRVLEWSGLYRRGRIQRVVDYRVAEVAVVVDNFAGVADVLAVVTAEAAREIKMTDVVWVSLPVGLHLGKKVSLKDALNFRDGALDGGLLF